MANSPIHQILNDLRSNYTLREVSEIDIRRIEEKYKICSIINFRNGTQAFLRITSFGLAETMFEDVVLDYSNVVFNGELETKIFEIKKTLFNLAYGVLYVESDKPLINEYIGPSFDLKDMESELVRMTNRCKELEMKIQKLETKKNNQFSLFDM